MAPSTGFAIAGKGTSYATPMVSGMLALLMARNSALSPGEYIDVARAAATPPAPAPHGQNWAGAGVIDLGQAVARVPLTAVGLAMHDWLDVDAGSTVVAVVDGITCGETVTSSPLVGSFSIFIKAHAELAGCGAPGKTVNFLVNGLDAIELVEWGGRDVDLNTVGLEISSVSPPPGPIVVQELTTGWNNVGHLGLRGTPPSAFSYLPATWEEIRVLDPVEGTFGRFSMSLPGYANDRLVVSTYGAFWVLLGGPSTVATGNPDPALGRAIALPEGWNNFVYTGTSRPVREALSDIDGLYSQVAHFENSTSEWLFQFPDGPRFLNDFGGLMRLNVYWVYMTEPGILTMR